MGCRQKPSIRWIALILTMVFLPNEIYSLGKKRGGDNRLPSDFDGRRLAQKIDSYFSRTELLKERREVDRSRDNCQEAIQGENRFSSRLNYFVNQELTPDHRDLGGISRIYKLKNSPIRNSLISHRMCHVSKESLRRTLKLQSRVPSDLTINKLNRFVNRYNLARDRYLNGQGDAEVKTVWNSLMGCLAYTESLTTADGSRSRDVARRHGPSGYKKPLGVKFYLDPHQRPESRLNIGLYQFTPNSRGNIRPCLSRWNRLYSRCREGLNDPQSEMTRLTGSPRQNFNAFCGVDKILQSFYVQVNTLKSQNTHPSNISRGALINSDDRCVSLHFYAGYSYNHFGPLQNTTRSNLDHLMTCTLDAMGEL